MDPKIAAMQMAIDLYCCLKKGGGVGHGSGEGSGITDKQIAESLGIPDFNNLLHLLEQLAKKLYASINSIV